ncbi:MAG TPA: LON peptidase substrate-binding domain-containing protein [Azoarcus taiwanensis]|uniref:Peptidase S16 n=1 Tax=Azoarcus taiwanensis TaxID=666964 RepID=A0A972FGR0_9RHOO|nr:LON peptidase substrate-binding domain-containing protein [Azoarcus taiwanensis]NMG05042.1 peptidase S16 [Azoarcus taiwanensis]HRQ57447.1 LON peptidase substrate-binding domain-containing protein [Azoarcus taiwanensis]
MRESSPRADQPCRIPIFPLRTVLFPGGVLPLRVFEARYMDMTARCMRESGVFGVCLIAEGSEVGQPAVPHAIGTSARIITWDMVQPGLLQLVTHGEQRFRILSAEAGSDGLLSADVEWLPAEPAESLPEGSNPLVALLQVIIQDSGELHFPPPHRFDDAEWVGMRLSSVLPMPDEIRQQLLELEDPLTRIAVLRTFLTSQGLTAG